MPRNVAILQARVGSSRLPGKVLESIAGRSVLEWVVARVAKAQLVDEVVVATSVNPLDSQVETLCRQLCVRCVRGDEDDVLGRFLAAADLTQAERIVRINADNPLIDPQFIDALLREAAEYGGDYISYALSSGLPVMLCAVSFFAECVSYDCLKRAAANITDKHLREHVTLGIYKNPEEYSVTFLPVPRWADSTDFRLTLDTPADLERLRAIIETHDRDLLDVGAEDILRHVQAHPEWIEAMRRDNETQKKS